MTRLVSPWLHSRVYRAYRGVYIVIWFDLYISCSGNGPGCHPKTSARSHPKLTLSGGVPHHFSLVGPYIRLTDFAVCAEGVDFKAHWVALASSLVYFLNLFKSGMRDASGATYVLQGTSPTALESLLAFIYEAKCEIDEGLLTEVLEAAARLVVDALKDPCADAIGARLVPSNALNVWRLADTFTRCRRSRSCLHHGLLHPNPTRHQLLLSRARRRRGRRQADPRAAGQQP